MSEEKTGLNTQNTADMQNILATVEVIKKYYGEDIAQDLFIVLERHMRLGTLPDTLDHIVNWSKMYARGIVKDRVKMDNNGELTPLQPWHEEKASRKGNQEARVLLREILNTYRGKILYQYVKTGKSDISRSRISQMRKELKAYVNG